MPALTESEVEEAALSWLESLDCAVKRGPDIAQDTLAALRDALLLKLISGEIRINDAEKFVEAAV